MDRGPWTVDSEDGSRSVRIPFLNQCCTLGIAANGRFLVDVGEASLSSCIRSVPVVTGPVPPGGSEQRGMEYDTWLSCLATRGMYDAFAGGSSIS